MQLCQRVYQIYYIKFLEAFGRFLSFFISISLSHTHTHTLTLSHSHSNSHSPLTVYLTAPVTIMDVKCKILFAFDSTSISNVLSCTSQWRKLLRSQIHFALTNTQYSVPRILALVSAHTVSSACACRCQFHQHFLYESA